MRNLSSEIVVNLFHVPILMLLMWAAYRKFVSRQPLPAILAVPGRLVRIALIVMTFGSLVGCSSSDPLAVASGPMFPLNIGHWQPTPGDLAAPPHVADR